MNNLIIQFANERIKEEFNNPKLDNRLKIIVYALAGFINFNFSKALVLTGIFRTQEEQDEIYKDNFQYQKEKWSSVHQFGCGTDCSIKYFTDDELQKIGIFLDKLEYDKSRPTKKCWLIHDIGLGRHGHIQVYPASFFTKIY